MSTVRTRPAEAGGLAAAVVALIIYTLGIDDPALVAPLIIIVGSVPAVVTRIVNLAARRNGQDG